MVYSPCPVYIGSYINRSIYQSPGRVPAQWQTFNRGVVPAAMSTESVLPDASGQPASRSDAITKASLQLAGSGSEVRSASALILRNTQKSVTGRTHPTAGALAAGSQAERTPLQGAVSLVFAIADHPRVDSANGAAARIAMTVGERVAKDDARESGAVERGSDPDSGQPTRRSAKPKSKSGSDPLSAADPIASPTQSTPTGHLLTVTHKQTGEFGKVAVTLVDKTGLIHADLSVDANRQHPA